MTTKNVIDYPAVLVDLEKRQAQLTQAIAGIKQIIDQNSDRFSISKETFSGMTISSATLKYLRMVGKPQKVRLISEALESGGVVHKSKNFISTVNTVLVRKVITGGPFVKVGAGWGLKEWANSDKFNDKKG